MVGFISDFALLLIIVAAVVLYFGSRNGWFLSESAPTAKAKPIDVKRAPVSEKLARAKEDKDGDVPSSPIPVAQPPETPATETGPPDVHPAVAAAARFKGIKSAEKSLSDHWASDTIKARPGWLMFELEDFLGASSTKMHYMIPGAGRGGELVMYPIADVRAIEHGDNLIARSRRRVIIAKWQDRKRRAIARAAE